MNIQTCSMMYGAARTTPAISAIWMCSENASPGWV